MLTIPTGALRRLIGVLACGWTLLFAAPHAWWAFGLPAGFPGGEASYREFMASSWLYLYNLAVVVLCGVAVLFTVRLLRPTSEVRGRRAMRVAVWLGSGALLLRGLAGLVVDGATDPIWWPTFLAGGVLFGGVAWTARPPGPDEATPDPR